MVNSLWPNDGIWRHRSGPTLVQVIAYCLMAPSHYLNHCCLINKVLWYSYEGNEIQNILIEENAFQSVVFKMSAILSRPLCDDLPFLFPGAAVCGTCCIWSAVLLHRHHYRPQPHLWCYHRHIRRLEKWKAAKRGNPQKHMLYLW